MKFFFEKHKVPCYFTASQPYFSLISSGGSFKSVIVESGYGITQIAIYDSHINQKFSKAFKIGGIDLSMWLKSLLNYDCHLKNFYDLNSDDIFFAIEDIKQKHTYVNQKRNPVACKSTIFTLVDGNTLEINTESYECPEPLFNKSVIDESLERYYHGTHKEIYKGINDLNFDSLFRNIQNEINDAIMECDIENKEELFNNIIISGGNTMFKGFGDRLIYELTNLVNPEIDVNIFEKKDRNIQSWNGESVLACDSYFNNMYITYDEYNDVGSNIVHTKCKT